MSNECHIQQTLTFELLFFLYKIDYAVFFLSTELMTYSIMYRASESRFQAKGLER